MRAFFFLHIIGFLVGKVSAYCVSRNLFLKIILAGDLKKVHPFSEKYACFFQKGCTLFILLFLTPYRHPFCYFNQNLSPFPEIFTKPSNLFPTFAL